MELRPVGRQLRLPHSRNLFFPGENARSWEGLGEAHPGRAASWPGLCAIAPGHRAGAPPLWKLTRSIPIQLASSRSQPASSLPRLETGLPGLGTKHCLELSAQGLVPLHWCCDREPKGTGEGPKPHAHDSALELTSGEAQSVRRFLNTNGGTLWLWSSLPKQGH